ncbi:MAG: PAS domain S-box protein [Methanobacterium sp.]|nr:PAS domain S-box protein [Methanobacterium sp.]
MHSNHDDNWESIREKIIGLGEQSIRKSYYPELQDRLSELERFRALLDETNDIIFLSKVPSGRFADFNKSASEQLGYSYQEMLEMSVEDIMVPDEIQGMNDIISNLISTENLKNRKTIETILKKKDNTPINMEINLSVVCFSDEPYIVMVARDITERKEFENTIKSSLNEKEMLLKEIHHRVKNNLQIISSLLALQEDYVKEDPTAVNVLQESRNRVISMAMIHEMLYQSKDLSHINFADYLRSMMSNLFHTYGVENVIKTEINVDKIYLNVETSVPLGLIISELVSNSLKYAFPEERDKNEILVSLHRLDGEFELVISDNGVGLPGNIDFKNPESTLGLRLVNSLINQLDGSIELDRSQGTEFKINFKELEYKKRI